MQYLKTGETKVGYLYNLRATSRPSPESGSPESVIQLYFLDKHGKSFTCMHKFQPYFLVNVGPTAVELALPALKQRFPGASSVAFVEKEDLELPDHLSGKRHTFIRMDFVSMEPYSQAKRQLMNLARDNAKAADIAKTDPLDFVVGLAEHDVPLHVRACIDRNIRCAKWYRVSIEGSVPGIVDDTMVTTSSNSGNAVLELLPHMLNKPELRVFAWDIETSKAPLKFPDANIDPMIMISVMADGKGYLFVNREEVVRDIEDFEYAPKPDMEGHFTVANCEDEKAMTAAFFALIKRLQPHILVTFNGDFFDFPYVAKRAEILGLDMGKEIGVNKVMAGPDGEYYSGRSMIHLDCYAWVQRDSYLPQGSQGLKAVTKYKLKYDPVELDPEDITPFARTNPQELASYSVSDALATYYLFKKYIQDFIFALCTVIPTAGDEVLRKGSGTLCEMLLMAEAFRANVVFPNKHREDAIQFHNGRLIETSTYEGGRVECLRTGIYRSDFIEKFHLDLDAIRDLQKDVPEIVRFFCEKEANVDVSKVTNFDSICNDIYTSLEALAVNPTRDEEPLIYHLDVAAMYPNIILSNRLQPSAVVTKDNCATCSFNQDAESNQCQRPMNWKWRGELYKATKADVSQITRELEAPAHKYVTKDMETGEMKKVPWKDLSEKDQNECLFRNVRTYSSRAYKRIKSPVTEDRTDIVCQRENSFYIDTVRAFRDRRYEFKDATKTWKGKLDNADAAGDAPAAAQARDMILLFDSLQLAHKCILNSFYGYVMRKGARWHSMKMAGIVTFTGSNLIREAREFVDRMGIPLELDTDGIWCLLPKSFPDRFKLEVEGGKPVVMNFPCSVLNIRVHRKYSNHQYQHQNPETGEWTTSTENSIFFEIDGPYKAMIIPASTEEDRMLKKRYAVFNFDGSIAELKGFEIKRRGELKLIQVFQENVFPAFMQGSNRDEVYAAVGAVANTWINILDTQGEYITDSELIYLISERKNMTKSVADSGDLKSSSITTVKRIASFLGDSILREKGISCHLVIANRPVDASASERAIPVQIFSADEAVKRSFLRKWLNDPFMTDYDMRRVIDWNYYKTRLGSAVQKLVIIPALEQRIPNPCPSIEIVDWMKKRLAVQNDKFQQTKLGFVKLAGPAAAPQVAEGLVVAKPTPAPQLADDPPVEEIETRVPLSAISEWTSWQKSKWTKIRKQRLLGGVDRRNISAQQSSMTADLVKSVVNPGSAKIKNRKLGVMPWHIVSVDATGPILELWTSLGDCFQRVTLPNVKRVVVEWTRVGSRMSIAEFVAQIPFRVKYTELGNGYKWIGSEGGMILAEFFVPFTEASRFMELVTSAGAGLHEEDIAMEFDLTARLGAIVSVKDVSSVPEQFFSSLSLSNEDYETDEFVSAYSFLRESKEKYLPFKIDPIFIHFAETTTPSVRMFACVFVPKLGRIMAGFVGVPPAQRSSEKAIEKLVREKLEAAGMDSGYEIHASFHDTVAPLSRAMNRFLEDAVRKVGSHAICVLAANGSTETISTSVSSFYLPALRQTPVARSPFSQLDSAFPALDWWRSVLSRWASRAPLVEEWWEDHLWLARVARVPICDLPPSRHESSAKALDVMLARSLKSTEIKHLLWGNESTSAEADAVAILCPERSERAQESELSNPGIYRSVCLSLSLGTSLCVAALSRANQQLLEQSLVNEPQFQALVHVVDAIVQRGKTAQTKLQKMTGAPTTEMDLRQMEPKSAQLLAETQGEVAACAQLLNSVFSWLSAGDATLFSPELLSLTVQAMNQTLDQLVDQLKKSGCEIIHANFTKVVFSTGKTSVAEVRPFWTTLRLNILDHPILRNLGLDESSVSMAMFGMTWYDNSNYAFIPVNHDGTIDWRVEAHWKFAECLPPALRAHFYTYTSEFLVNPMKAMTKFESSLSNAQKQSELATFILNKSVPQIRKKLYTFISEVEVRRQSDFVILNAAMDDDLDGSVHSDASDFEDPPEVRRRRRMNEIRAKWEFPMLPGIVMPAATKGLSPGLEFAKLIWEIISLERIDARATERIAAMRNDLLKFFKVSPFSQAAEFQNPIHNSSACKVHNTLCFKCGTTSAVDIVTGPFKGPGLWECPLCSGVYDRDLIETKLVTQINVILKGWQSQTLQCEKCKSAKSKFLGKYCDCSGKFKTRIQKEVALDAVNTIHSVAVAHNLKWLEEHCQFFLTRI
jgi:DNA polymerase epsilon subunit 1